MLSGTSSWPQVPRQRPKPAEGRPRQRRLRLAGAQRASPEAVGGIGPFSRSPRETTDVLICRVTGAAGLQRVPLFGRRGPVEQGRRVAGNDLRGVHRTVRDPSPARGCPSQLLTPATSARQVVRAGRHSQDASRGASPPGIPVRWTWAELLRSAIRCFSGRCRWPWGTRSGRTLVGTLAERALSTCRALAGAPATLAGAPATLPGWAPEAVADIRPGYWAPRRRRRVDRPVAWADLEDEVWASGGSSLLL